MRDLLAPWLLAALDTVGRLIQWVAYATGYWPRRG